MGIGVLHTVEALNGMLEAGDTVCCTVDCGGGIKAVSTHIHIRLLAASQAAGQCGEKKTFLNNYVTGLR